MIGVRLHHELELDTLARRPPLALLIAAAASVVEVGDAGHINGNTQIVQSTAIARLRDQSQYLFEHLWPTAEARVQRVSRMSRDLKCARRMAALKDTSRCWALEGGQNQKWPLTGSEPS